MAIKLGDDGTLDTVLYCDKCGDEFRFNFANDTFDIEDTEPDYDDFIEDCIAEVKEEHIGRFGRCIRDDD